MTVSSYRFVICGWDSSNHLTVSLPANFTVWLASPEAEFLNGRYTWSNWDVGELKSKKEAILKDNLLVMDLRGWPAT